MSDHTIVHTVVQHQVVSQGIPGPPGEVQDLSGLVPYHGVWFHNSYNEYGSRLDYDLPTRTLVWSPAGYETVVGNDKIEVTYWIQGQQHNELSLTLQHPATEGDWFFLINSENQFVCQQTVWDLSSDIPIALVHYDATTTDALVLDERHHFDSNKQWHESQHFAIGTYVKRATDFVIGGYTLNTGTNAAVSYSIGAGTIVDEDIQTAITELPDGGLYQVWRKSGASGVWRRSARSLPFYWDAGTFFAQYNQFTGGAWQLTALANNDRVNYYVFAVPSVETDKQFLILPGQAKYATLALAQAESTASLDLSGFPSQEYAALYRVTLKVSSGSGSPTGKVQIEAVERLLGTRNTVLLGGAAPTLHNALSGRSDADAHPISAITGLQAIIDDIYSRLP